MTYQRALSPPLRLRYTTRARRRCRRRLVVKVVTTSAFGTRDGRRGVGCRCYTSATGVACVRVCVCVGGKGVCGEG